MTRHRWCRHAVPLALVIGFSMPAIAAGQGIPAAHVPLSTTLGDIAKLRTGYTEAFNAKDAKTVSANFTADAVLIDVDGSQTMGAKSIATKQAADAPNWPHAVVAANSTKVYGATAVEVGTWTVHPKEGGEVVYRYLVVLRHTVNGWKLQNVAVAPAVPK